MKQLAALIVTTLALVLPAQAAPPAGWAVTTERNGKVCVITHTPQAAPDNTLVNTHLMRNARNHMILMIARADWKAADAQTHVVSLSIDGGEVLSVETSGLGPLILAEIGDTGVEQKLRGAQALVWVLPSGRFTANVAGLGAAFDMLASC